MEEESSEDCIRIDPADYPDWKWGDPTCIYPEDPDSSEKDEPEVDPNAHTIRPNNNSNNRHQSKHHEKFNWKHPESYVNVVSDFLHL